MGFMDSLRHKYELYRLEQRYTRREKRTTFASGATYVDGEYIYQNGPPPLSPGEGAPETPSRSTTAAATVVATSGTGMEFPSSPSSSGKNSPVPTGAGSSNPGSPMSASSEREEGKSPWGRVGNVWN